MQILWQHKSTFLTNMNYFLMVCKSLFCKITSDLASVTHIQNKFTEQTHFNWENTQHSPGTSSNHNKLLINTTVWLLMWQTQLADFSIAEKWSQKHALLILPLILGQWVEILSSNEGRKIEPVCMLTYSLHNTEKIRFVCIYNVNGDQLNQL